MGVKKFKNFVNVIYGSPQRVVTVKDFGVSEGNDPEMGNDHFVSRVYFCSTAVNESVCCCDKNKLPLLHEVNCSLWHL